MFLRGGGDLGSGVALRLVHAGIPVVISELAMPLSVRRLVCFSEAVNEGEVSIEGIKAVRTHASAEVLALAGTGVIPVIVDGAVSFAEQYPPFIWVDARMLKHAPETGIEAAPLVIGLGPGFTAGLDCHAVIETNRGPRLGRVIWHGSTESNTGLPEQVGQFREQRVLRAPVSGKLESLKSIGDQVSAGMPLARIGDEVVHAPFNGIIRGMMRDGNQVEMGVKIGDLDPRNDPALCRLVSDKSLSIAGGVMEAILSLPDIRMKLYGSMGE